MTTRNEFHMEKGDFYNYEDQAPDLVEWGLAGRCENWPQAQIAIQELLKAQSQGLVGGPDKKLVAFKSKVFNEWPWCLKWVPVDEEGPDEGP